MKAVKVTKVIDLGIKDIKYTLELSPVEMHFLMCAMSSYSNSGYGYRKHGNMHHVEGAEKMHDKLMEVYCDND